MEAKVSSKASHAWKSILKETEMLSKGAKLVAHTLCCTHIYAHIKCNLKSQFPRRASCWIGNDKSVCIWFNNWLPLKSHPRVTSIVLHTIKGKLRLVLWLIQFLGVGWMQKLMPPFYLSWQKDALIWALTQSSDYLMKRVQILVKQRANIHV